MSTWHPTSSLYIYLPGIYIIYICLHLLSLCSTSHFFSAGSKRTAPWVVEQFSHSIIVLLHKTSHAIPFRPSRTLFARLSCPLLTLLAPSSCLSGRLGRPALCLPARRWISFLSLFVVLCPARLCACRPTVRHIFFSGWLLSVVFGRCVGFLGCVC